MSRAGTVAIDVGGTFTDITFADAATGATWVAKTPSTPSDLSGGFITAVRKVLALAGRTPGDILHVFHGTTTATNAILEGKTPPTAVVTTAGFKYVLEIGRHDIPRHGNLYGWSKPARPVAPDRVLEVTERLDVGGAVLTALDEAEARAVARQLAQLGVPAVAVVFLHAYANPAHERRMQAILQEEHPGVLVSLSSEVLPQFREFERTMATALNAAVMPPVSRYVSVLRDALDAEGVRAPLLIMKSDGGVTSAATCVRQPIQTVLSGPAAGVIGALSVAGTAGHRDIISIDVGGTSADICLVREGRPEITKEGMIGPFPLKLPMVDIHTIGAGGGSIAAVSAAGRLTVGPRSAGAEPGPVCYGRGGAEPTVTDAHLVLGRIPPALLGGELPLDGAAARAAIDARVGRRLGLGAEEAAAGIVEIIDNSMARAIRTVSVGRGHDPRRFALVAFGGAGPLHACRLAELLDIPTVIIPPRPGVLSTWGLLDTDMRATFVRTVGTAERHLGEGPAAARGVDVQPLEATWGELEAQARAWLDTEEIPRDRQRFERSADLRYEHQSFELTCPLGEGAVTTARLAELTATFHAEHRRLYTYDLPGAPIELVNLRVTAIGALPRRRAPATQAAGASHAMTDRRQVYFRGTGFVATPCYARGALAPGMGFEGPAIITQDDSAPLVAPGFRARVDGTDNILLERSRG
ncbi:MAG TPA: hydantoinase/oxoprolinase family protein [Methylomirabilota bacterium]|nr:hydantoinase/oxoprolinase family protein [Methylomirabilota bacterium]